MCFLLVRKLRLHLRTWALLDDLPTCFDGLPAVLPACLPLARRERAAGQLVQEVQ